MTRTIKGVGASRPIRRTQLPYACSERLSGDSLDRDSLSRDGFSRDGLQSE